MERGSGAYTTATCSGRVEMSGNLDSMSVKTLERGWDVRPRLGSSSVTTLGYAGPIRSIVEAPFSACCRLSARKSRRSPSSGHVALTWRGGRAQTGTAPLKTSLTL